MMLANMMRFGEEATRRGFLDERSWGSHQLIWPSSPTMTWVAVFMCVISWLVFLAVLVALARWLWLKGNKERKNR